MQLLQCAEPVPGQEPADVLRSAVFMANFAAQDLTGRIDASSGVTQLLDALAHPDPHETTYVFAVSDTDVPGELSPLGFPIIPATGDHDEPEYLGWLIATTPLVDNTDVLGISLILDVDLQPIDGALPDEGAEVVRFMLRSAKELARTLGRHTIQLWQQQSLTGDSPLAATLTSAGFESAMALTEYVLPIPAGVVTGDVKLIVNEDFPPEVASQVSEIYADASMDQPWGTLTIEREKWDTQRLAESTAQFRALGTRNIHALAFDGDQLIGISEVWLHEGADPAVGIQGLTYVLPARRTGAAGLDVTLARAAMAAARTEQPQLERIYASAADGHDTQLALLQALGAEPVSRIGAWQLVVK